jgi:hypothetical protein
MDTVPKIKTIKHDAIVKIEIGTGFLQKLQQVFLYLAKDLTQEQLDKYKKEVENQEGFSEDWMNHITTISVLLKEVEERAADQGFVTEQEIENPNQQDN